MRVNIIKKQYDTADLEIVGATLLSVEEVELVPESLRMYECCWWLRSPGGLSDSAACVSIFGSVDYAGDYVRGDYVAVRPALIIKNLKSFNLKIGDIIFFGDKTFEIISDALTFCTTDIGCHCFNSDYEKEGANIYETSDIKKFVDDWFKKNKKEAREENL